MKYKKKYNIILSFMLVVITLSATMFFCLPKFKEVESEKSQEIAAEVEAEQGTTSQSLKKVDFKKFKTALSYSTKYLNSITGYKSTSTGKISLNIKNLVNIEQAVKITTEVNNKNNASHTMVATYGTGKIKADRAWEFTKLGDEISFRKSTNVNDGVFDFTDRDVTRLSTSDYLKEWSVLPEKAFTSFDISRISDGTMTKNQGEYTLKFTLANGDIIDQTIPFVKRFFDNSKNSQAINPSFHCLDVEMTLDQYGRPTKIQYSVRFYDLSLYGVGIPLSGITGAVTYTQRLYSFGQNVQVAQMPDPPKTEE